MKQLLLDSVFKIHYNQGGLRLNKWPSSSIKQRGTFGILQQPKLYQYVQKSVNKALEPISSIGENNAKGPTLAKEPQNMSTKKGKRSISQSSTNLNKNKKSKIRLV